MGSSEDPSLVNNVDELGLVYYGLNQSGGCITARYVLSPYITQILFFKVLIKATVLLSHGHLRAKKLRILENKFAYLSKVNLF